MFLNMEEMFDISSIFFATLLLFALVHFFFKTAKPQSQTTNDSLLLPPGNTGWPFIGESLEYLSTTKKGMPENFVTNRAKKYSTNVFKTCLFGEKMAVLCTAEGNKFLFSNENKLVQLWWPINFQKVFPNSDESTTGRESLRLRKALMSFIKPASLQKYIDVMDSMAKKQLLELWDEKQVLVHPLLRKFTFTLGCHLFFDIKDLQVVEKLENIFHKLGPGLVSLPINFPGTKFNHAINASKTLRKEFEYLIKQRKIELIEKRVSPSEDILSRIIVDAGKEGEHLDELAIASKVVGLIMASHDTGIILLVWIIKILAEMPEVYTQVLKEQVEIANMKGPGELLNWEDINKMTYSWNVVKEIMRLNPPVPGLFREVINDFTYEGFLIPKGWKIHWIACATHKNEEYFPNPNKFDPSRFEGKGPPPYAYVPFGGGPRMCPGNEYARLVILVFVHNLVTKFRWEKVLADEQVICDPFPRPAQGLPIRLYLHEF